MIGVCFKGARGPNGFSSQLLGDILPTNRNNVRIPHERGVHWHRWERNVTPYIGDPKQVDAPAPFMRLPFIQRDAQPLMDLLSKLRPFHSAVGEATVGEWGTDTNSGKLIHLCILLLWIDAAERKGDEPH
jgi:hypothetical protein